MQRSATDRCANVGDEVVVEAAGTAGSPAATRTGQIMEVRETDDLISYRVRWDDDGRCSTFFPSSTPHVLRQGTPMVP